MSTVANLRSGIGRTATSIRGMLRRVAVKLTTAADLWQLLGYRDADDNDEIWSDVDAFQGVGFASRPATGGTPEAILIQVGGGNGHAVVIATRDTRGRPTMAADEVAIHTSSGALRSGPSQKRR